MKEISIKIDDELYRRASGKIEDLEAEVMAFLPPELTWQGFSTQPGTLAWA